MDEFNAQKLKEILKSPEFRHNLAEISAYGAHIKQERPICYLIANHLTKKWYDFTSLVLEKTFGKNQWFDMVINGTKIEAKFYYESDLEFKLKKEMNQLKWHVPSVAKKLDELKKKHKSYSWWMTLPIYEDMVVKSPDIFLLIILSRDLSRIDQEIAKNNICWGKAECQYRRYNDNDSLKFVDIFFKQISKKRPFSHEHVPIEVSSVFPSTYHFYICDFISEKKGNKKIIGDNIGD